MGNLEMKKIRAIFIQLLSKNKKIKKNLKKKNIFGFVLGNTCAILTDCMLL